MCCNYCFPSSLQELFTDVYGGSTLPPHLATQFAELQEHMAKYPDHYVSGH